MGAEVIVNVVKTTTSDRAQELVLARANAIVNQVFLVSVNAAGPVGRGQSLVVDPEGLVRVAAPSETAVTLTDVLDLDHVTRARTFGTAGLNRLVGPVPPGRRAAAAAALRGPDRPGPLVAGPAPRLTRSDARSRASSTAGTRGPGIMRR